jgi:predicted secreted protein
MFGSSMTRLFLINGTRTLASLFLVIVLVLGSRQSSYPAEHEIRAILKQPFRIVLAAAIGSTGYSWSARFDEGFLKLEKSWYEKPESKLVGAPGKQVFVFVPLKQGNAKIEMLLKRPWESSELKTEVYEISILPK